MNFTTHKIDHMVTNRKIDHMVASHEKLKIPKVDVFVMPAKSNRMNNTLTNPTVQTMHHPNMAIKSLNTIKINMPENRLMQDKLERMLPSSTEKNLAKIISNPTENNLAQNSSQFQNSTDPIFYNQIIELCKANNIEIIYDDKLFGNAAGIGDILLKFASMRFKTNLTPFYLNLEWFTRMYYRMNPINQLEFRIKLIMDLCATNNIPNDMVKFIYSKNAMVNAFVKKDYDDMIQFNLESSSLNLNETSKYGEYIIFHTKCRHTSNENYDVLKHNVGHFCSNYKSKCNLVILGERNFPKTEEVELHGITQLYSELLNLTKHNHVIDLSIDCIYANLDYESYKKDISIVKNARCNISFGIGGALCTSICFGKSTIFYCKNEIMGMNKSSLIKNDIHHFDNIHTCFDRIYEMYL